MTLIKVIDFNVFGDKRGHLIALENNKNIPFDSKRTYYMYGMDSLPRGFHAHKKTKQLAICLNGSCEVVMDDGISKGSIILDCPSKGLIIDVMQWHEIHDFSKDCIVLVLASEYYDESDYIRNYDDFLLEVIEHVHP